MRAAVDFIVSHKYYLVSPTWAVLSQGAGGDHARLACLSWLGLPRDKTWPVLGLPGVLAASCGGAHSLMGRDGRVQVHQLQLAGVGGRGSGEVETLKHCVSYPPS